ncbi:probable ATP-dependent DNA helicase HFM1 isoform X2 [Corythoichthys intestinalis]|uniref:probable ATP-dependent DNA helicase HFM1 isoform X2 n=1 Tax=Corythoichthys intestinalis TaxID=161448 RepID=UPI0025A4F5DA|nr:probable ATP-dependent DNA helicase HFM1 isoform X2 [Corythoichthys intestinalis]
MNKMLDSDDTWSLDELFSEKTFVQKVNPLHQEVRPWRLEAPPSLSQIPATQVMQEDAELLTTLYSISQMVSNNPIEKEGNESQENTQNYITFGIREGECFKDPLLSPHQSRIDGEHIRQDTDQENFGIKYSSVDDRKHLPLQRSLFKVPVSRCGGDSSNPNDLCQSRTASRPQTFRSPVSMATVPPPFQPPRATFYKAAPPSPFQPASFLPPRLVSSAVSVNPPQRAVHVERQDKDTMRALVPSTVPPPLHIQGSSELDSLRPVSEILKFRPVFSEFPFFNFVQSKALDDILYTDKNFVACAPTGSGKTVLFELAIIHLLMKTSEPWHDVKVVYIAPIKALCSQCFENWTKKFGPLGLKCKELTGDTEIDDIFEIQDAHIILTTPEKWDSMTRRWKSNCLLQLVRLILIDEVHVVKNAARGATLEVVVSRMKAVHGYMVVQNQDTGITMRFLAVSATIPNISDIADWLSNEKGPASYLQLDDSHRPVKLRKVVLGFPCNENQSEFKFDLSLNYKMGSIIQTYSDQKPALVFCSTRKGTQQSAAVLAKDARFLLKVEHKQRLIKYAQSLQDSKLRDLVVLGVGYHHAGVEASDRKVIEKAFTLGDLPVLFTTRTLAMGVNLPAHLVVIKSTMQYSGGSCEEYSEADLLQMIGRAGRPQFDTSATAVIMTKMQTRDKHTKLMNGMEIIESSLHSHLVEHLNAEIVLQTISNVSMAQDWIRSTFLYIRALKNPLHYGFPTDLDRSGIESKLHELCLKNLNALHSIGLIIMDEDISVKPTEAGGLMARYCIAFDTMKQFSKLSGTENLSDLIGLVSKSREFWDIQLRVMEKRPLNNLNRNVNATTIRFPMEGKIKSSDMKVNCLIQAQLGSISIQEFGLTQDTAKIFRIGLRISKCLSEYLSQNFNMGFSTLLNALILAKCFRAKLWENSVFVSKQLDKIGQTLSTVMVNAGLTTFSKIEQTNPREIEMILNRHPPFGNQIQEFILYLPKYELSLEQLPRYSSSIAEIVVKVTLKNQKLLMSKRTAPDHHYVSLLIGDSDNNCVFRQKLTDLALLKCSTWSKKIEVKKALKGNEISVHLISSEYVGLDVQQNLTVYYYESAHNRSYDSSGDTSQQSTTNFQSVGKSARRRGNAASTEQDAANKRQCNHLCKNKNQCGHDCCKIGVAVVRKRPAGKSGFFSSFLDDLKSRCDTLGPSPVKRLKMKMMESSVGVNMEHSYKAKPQHTLTSGGGYHHSVPDAIMDIAEDGSSQYPQYTNEFDNERNAGFHASSPWQGSHQTTRNNSETLSKIPNVSFDLGNDWDDWDDFDVEEPVQIGDTSLTQAQQSAEWKLPGYLTTPQCRPTGIALRTSSQATPNNPGHSPLTPRLQNQAKMQSPSMFDTVVPPNAPEKTSNLVAQLTPRFNFFTTTSGPFDAIATDNSSKNEDVFDGIFDGIF